MVTWAKRTSESQWFDWLTVWVILANAVALGLQTFSGFNERHGETLIFLNGLCFGYYCVELGIRITAYFPKPWQFFKGGWNVFDFLIVTLGLIPGLRENATLLRLIRLLRVTRLFRLLPDLRVIVHAVGRSIPKMTTLALASAMLVYLYAMVGWVIFHEGDPKLFGNVGEAMLTMFQVLTLEGLPEFIAAGREVSDWAIPFYVSYVLLASFLVFNLFIGIVLGSMEEARAAELRMAEMALRDQSAEDDEAAAELAIRERMRAIREYLDEIESDLAVLDEARKGR